MITKFTVRERYGWGWGVTVPTGEPEPPNFSTAAAAQAFCDARNAGKSHDEAFDEACEHGKPQSFA